jgi:hypothetical protein
MFRRVLITLTALCAVTLSPVPNAAAHEAARVETEVKLAPSGALDVTHILQLSAAQRLLFKAGIIDKNDMTGLRARAQAALYGSERFALKADGKPIPLEILGAEVTGGHLYIYQTGTLDALPETWSAQNAILRDLSPRFDNIINLPTKGGIRTLTFSGSELDIFQSP